MGDYNSMNHSTEFTVFVESEDIVYEFDSFEEMTREFGEEPIWNPEEEIFEILASEELTVIVEGEDIVYTFNSFEEMTREFGEEPIWNSEEEIYEVRASEEVIDEELEDWSNNIVKELPENEATVEEL